MRTTVTLDPDAEQIVRRQMRERRVSFKQALNDAIRAGAIKPSPAEAFHTETAPLGEPAVNLDRALQVAAAVEDEELLRKMRLGS